MLGKVVKFKYVWITILAILIGIFIVSTANAFTEAQYISARIYEEGRYTCKGRCLELSKRLDSKGIRYEIWRVRIKGYAPDHCIMKDDHGNVLDPSWEDEQEYEYIEKLDKWELKVLCEKYGM